MPGSHVILRAPPDQTPGPRDPGARRGDRRVPQQGAVGGHGGRSPAPRRAHVSKPRRREARHRHHQKGDGAQGPAPERGGAGGAPAARLPMTRPRIRLATPSDAPLLAELRLELRTALAPEVEPEAGFRERCAAWMADRLEPPGPWYCWLAEEADGALLGTVWVQILEKLPNPVHEPERHAYADGFLRAARRTKPRAGIGAAGGGAGPLFRARHRHGVSVADTAKPAAVRAPRVHGAGGSARAPALVPAMIPTDQGPPNWSPNAGVR